MQLAQAIATLPLHLIAERVRAALQRPARPGRTQAIEGLEVTESTWAEWEETCAESHTLAMSQAA